MRLAGAVMTAVWVAGAQHRRRRHARRTAGRVRPAGRAARDRRAARRSQQRYDDYTQQALDAGVFGAPSYVIDGELFWGQDRLDFVERALQGAAPAASNQRSLKHGPAIPTSPPPTASPFPPTWPNPRARPRARSWCVQEIFGVNSHIRVVADGYAAEGYLAVAPATFHRVKPGVELGYDEDDMKAGFALKTAVEALPGAGRAAGHPGRHRPRGARRQGRHRRLLLGRPADLARRLRS